MCTDCNTLFIYNFLQGALLKTLKDALHCNLNIHTLAAVAFLKIHTDFQPCYRQCWSVGRSTTLLVGRSWCSCSLQDEPNWIWWFSNFSFSGSSRWEYALFLLFLLFVFLWNLSTYGLDGLILGLAQIPTVSNRWTVFFLLHQQH